MNLIKSCGELWLRESGLIAEDLGIGATTLGKAGFGEADPYYTEAFFALWIGIERGAKLALSLSSASKSHGDFLSERQLRSYGHDLTCWCVSSWEQ